MDSAFAGVSAAAVVLTAFDITEFPAVARVSAVDAVPNAVHVPSVADVSNVSGLPAVGGISEVVGVRAVAGFPAMVNIPFLKNGVSASSVLLLASPDVPFAPCADVGPSVVVSFFLYCQRPWSFCCGLSSALASLLLLTLLASLQLLTSLLLQCFHRFWNPC
jgi:hypothetical protein